MRITIKDHFRETEIFLARVVFAGFVVLALVLTVIGRLAYLQMIQHDHYTTLSQSNRIHLLPVAPNRGLILDRDGVVLAQNYPTFTLSITPERAHGVNDTLTRLAEVIDLDEVDIQRFRKQLRHGRAYQTIPLRFRLSDEEVARFALDRYLFPGVELAAPLTRHYPQGELAAHVVGYVGRIDEQEVATLVDVNNYDGTNHIGKTGVEKTLHVGLTHLPPAGRHIVEFARFHPPLQFAHQVEEVIEIVHHKEQRLVTVDFKVLVDHPLQLQWVPLHLRRLNTVGYLTVR